MSNIFQNLQLQRIADAVSGSSGEMTLALGVNVPEMIGATASENGASGVVPAPQAGDENKFLTGAGTYVEQASGGGYDITTNGAPVDTGITWDGNPVKCFCFRNYNLSLNAQADNNLSWYGFSDTINGLFKVDCIVQNGSNFINVTPHVHYDGYGWLRGRYDTSESFTSGTGYIFMYYY